MESLFKQVCEHALRSPERVAIWRRLPGGDYDVTRYKELAASARAFARAFAQDPDIGRFIPLLMDRSADCVAAMLGAMGAGRAFVCLNPAWRPPQVSAVLEATEAGVGLLDGAGLMALRTATPKDTAITRAKWRLLRDSRFETIHEKAAAKLAEKMTVEDWSPVGEGEPPEIKDPDPVGCCLFTSGTTGQPKGVMIGTGDLMARAEAEADWYRLRETDVLLNVLVFSFDVGLNQVLSAMAVGCSLVLLGSWLPADMLRTVAERGVTGVSGVPSIWSDFIRTGLRFETSASHASLRYITVSGGDLSPEGLNRLPEVVEGVEIFKTYGQSETFRSTSLSPDDYDTKRTSVGRAFHKARVYVLHEDGTPAKPHETGEVVHTGMGTMLGYLREEDPLNKLRSNPFRGPDDPSEHAVFTGDQGYLDAEGFLYLLGRRDDMLKVAGNRIYPAEIRNQLAMLDGVVEAEVLGVPSQDGETRLCAFVVKTRQRILVRISPGTLPRGFGVNMAGKPCQFGIDEEDAGPALEQILALKHLDVRGFHIYSGTQCLDTESIAENYGIFIDLFRRLSEDHDILPEKLVFGSGLGIPYHDGNQPVDLPAVAERVNPMLAQLRSESRFSNTTLVLETGRYIVGEAGIYLTRVLGEKTSRGAEIRICDGGMNHHLGACGHLGSVIHRNYQMFKLGASSPGAEARPYDLVGPLCTSIDTLGHRVKFAGLDVGDVIAIRCSGAYGVTASPVYFISHDPPREVLVETRDGKTAIEDVSQLSSA